MITDQQSIKQIEDAQAIVDMDVLDDDELYQALEEGDNNERIIFENDWMGLTRLDLNNNEVRPMNEQLFNNCEQFIEIKHLPSLQN